MSKRTRISVLALLGAAGLTLAAFTLHITHWDHSLYLHFNRTGPLLVKTADGYAPVENVLPETLIASLRTDLRLDHVSHATLWLKRALPFEVHVFEFDPSHFAFEAAFREGFKPAHAAEMLESGGYQFIVNASFYDPAMKPLGWVVHQGIELSPEGKNWSGYFLVYDDGRVFFGPRSIRDVAETDIVEALQFYPSLIQDHEVFDYVVEESNSFFQGHEVTGRVLAGTYDDGRVVFMTTYFGGGLSVSEVAEIAQKLGLRNATLMDGGSSVQYAFDHDGNHLDFTATGRPVPVFIGVRERID